MSNLLNTNFLATGVDTRNLGPRFDTLVVDNIRTTNITYTGTINDLPGDVVTQSGTQALLNKSLQDTTTTIYNAAVSTKLIKFSAAASAANTTLTLSSAAVSSRTYTFPDAGADASFVLTAGAQTIGGIKTFTSRVAAAGFTSTLDNIVFGIDPQILIRGATNNNLQTMIGYNTTANYGYIQAIEQGVTARQLSVNGVGGNVIIGSTTSQLPSAPPTLEILSSNPPNNTYAGRITVGGVGVGDLQFSAGLFNDGGTKRILIGGHAPGLLSWAAMGMQAAADLFINETSGTTVIGSNTTSTGEKLKVHGSFRATGAATFDSSVTISGSLNLGSAITLTNAPALNTFGAFFRARNAATSSDRSITLGNYNNAGIVQNTLYSYNGDESAAADLFIRSANSFLNTAGTVVIGSDSTSTGEKLKVHGTFRATGAATFDSTLSITGTTTAATINATTVNATTLSGTIVSTGTFTSTVAAAANTFGGSAKLRTGTAVTDSALDIGSFNDGTNNITLIRAQLGDGSGSAPLLVRSTNTFLNSSGTVIVGSESVSTGEKLKVHGSFRVTGAVTLDSTLNITGTTTAATINATTVAATNLTGSLSSTSVITSTLAAGANAFGGSAKLRTGTTITDSVLDIGSFNDGTNNVTLIRAQLGDDSGSAPLLLRSTNTFLNSSGTVVIGSESTSTGEKLKVHGTFRSTGAATLDSTLSITGTTTAAAINATTISGTTGTYTGILTSTLAAGSNAFGGSVKLRTGTTVTDSVLDAGSFNDGTNNITLIRAQLGDGSGSAPLLLRSTNTFLNSSGTVVIGSEAISTGEKLKVHGTFRTTGATTLDSTLSITGTTTAATINATTVAATTVNATNLTGSLSSTSVITSTLAAGSNAFGGSVKLQTGTAVTDSVLDAGSFNDGTNNVTLIRAQLGDGSGSAPLLLRSTNTFLNSAGTVVVGSEAISTGEKLKVHGTFRTTGAVTLDSTLSITGTTTAAAINATTISGTTGTYTGILTSTLAAGANAFGGSTKLRTGTTSADSMLDVGSFNDGTNNVTLIRAQLGDGSGSASLLVRSTNTFLNSIGTVVVGSESTSTGEKLKVHGTFRVTGATTLDATLSITGTTTAAAINATTISGTTGTYTGILTSTLAAGSNAFGGSVKLRTGTAVTDSMLDAGSFNDGTNNITLIRAQLGDGSGSAPLLIRSTNTFLNSSGTVVVGSEAISTGEKLKVHGTFRTTLGAAFDSTITTLDNITTTLAASSGQFGALHRTRNGTTSGDVALLAGVFNTGGTTRATIAAFNGDESARTNLYVQSDGVGDASAGKLFVGYAIGGAPTTQVKFNLLGSVNASTSIIAPTYTTEAAATLTSLASANSAAAVIVSSGDSAANNANAMLELYGRTHANAGQVNIKAGSAATVFIQHNGTNTHSFTSNQFNILSGRISSTIAGLATDPIAKFYNTTSAATSSIEVGFDTSARAAFSYTHSVTDGLQEANINVGGSTIATFIKGDLQTTFAGGIQLADSTNALAGNMRYTANRADIYTDNTTANWKRVPQIRYCIVVAATVTFSVNYGFATVTRGATGVYTVTLSENWGVYVANANDVDVGNSAHTSVVATSNTVITVRTRSSANALVNTISFTLIVVT